MCLLDRRRLTRRHASVQVQFASNCTSRHSLSRDIDRAIKLDYSSASFEHRISVASAPQAWRPGRRTACAARTSQCRHDRRRRSSATKWLVGVVVLLALAASDTPRLGAQASLQGQWTTLPYLMPINPVHLDAVEQRPCAHRRGVGQRRDRDELSQHHLGSSGGHVQHALACVGHVLQRRGGAARRASPDQRRQPAVRPVSRASRRTPSTTRPPTPSLTSRTWRTGAGTPRPPCSATAAS